MLPDYIKALAIIPGYLILAPLIGLSIAHKFKTKKLLLCLLFFMTSWYPTKITLMLDSIEAYRGHTKGFESSLLVFVSIILISASLKTTKRFSWAPGSILFLLFCGLSTLSTINAIDSSYVWMATYKFFSAWLVMSAAFYTLETKQDIKWILNTLALSIWLQALVCLKLRIVDQQWQVHGWFEHQNPLAMWTYSCCLPLFAVGLSKWANKKEALLYLSSTAAGGLIILLTVSRAALGAYLVGTGIIFLCSMLVNRSSRIWITGLTGLAGCGLILLHGLNSLNARMDTTNTAEEDLRPALVRQAHAMLDDHVLGVGWNNYGLAASTTLGNYAYVMQDWNKERGGGLQNPEAFANPPLPENLYWVFFAEVGYPGTICFIMFMGYTLWITAMCCIAYRKTVLLPFIAGIFLVLALTCGHSTLERILTQTKNLGLWVMMIGCIGRLYYERKNQINWK